MARRESPVLKPEWVRLALRVGKVLREYEVPAYVVDVEDERVVREIFERTNSSGKPLEVSEVFHALHAPIKIDRFASLKDVVDRLRSRSVRGEIRKTTFCVASSRSKANSRSGDLHRQLAGVDVPAAVASSRHSTACSPYLPQEYGDPPPSSCPTRSPLTVLSTFFDKYPTPSLRARRLLSGLIGEELREKS